MSYFDLCIRIDKECRQESSVVVEAEVQGLFSEDNVIIYKDGSVIRQVWSS
uniref:Uncharacterized protein n=1 Tax=Arion vulgaris TaxID=1028688 RepID=A0A0B7ATW0_9EUPU